MPARARTCQMAGLSHTAAGRGSRKARRAHTHSKTAHSHNVRVAVRAVAAAAATVHVTRDAAIKWESVAPEPDQKKMATAATDAPVAEAVSFEGALPVPGGAGGEAPDAQSNPLLRKLQKVLKTEPGQAGGGLSDVRVPVKHFVPARGW